MKRIHNFIMSLINFRIIAMKSHTRFMLFALCALLTSLETAYAQLPGNFAAPLLRISPYARQVAMGEAATALSNDLNALRYNIGSLGTLDYSSFGIHYHQWIEDTYQGALEGAVRTRFGVIGANLTYFDEGVLSEIDENFNPTGFSFDNHDLALTLGYGYRFMLPSNSELGVGLSGKYVRQDLVNQIGTAFGADAGFRFAWKGIALGATLQNFTLSKLRVDTTATAFRLPETIRGGLAFDLPIPDRRLKWKVAVDAAKFADKNDKNVRIYAGTELRLSDLFSVRGGYKIRDEEISRWSAGFGLIIPMGWFGGSSTSLDYAYSPLEAFDTQAHRFSLSFSFGKVPATAGIFASGAADAELEKARRAREEAEEARLAALEAEGRLRDVEDRMSKLEEEMLRKFEEIKKIAESTQGQIEVAREAGTGNVLTTLRVNFDFDKSDIRTDMTGTLDKLAEILNTYEGSQLWIAGHTDNTGTDEYNFHLSERRMSSVMNYLVRRNVVSGRFVDPIPYGEWRPLNNNVTADEQFLNRRVEFLIYTGENKPGLHPASMIQTVAVRNDSIVVEGNGELSFTQKLLDNPPRALLVFPKVYIPDAKTFTINKGNVQQARLGFHPEDGSTWVVLDLFAPIAPVATSVGKTVRILPEPAASATKEQNR